MRVNPSRLKTKIAQLLKGVWYNLVGSEGESMQMGQPEKPDQFYLELVIHILKDAARSCNIRLSSISEDENHIRRRFVAEGIGFLTKSLPSLGKCLDKALSSDSQFESVPDFPKGKFGVPKFLGAFFKLIFNHEGLLYDLDLDSEAIQNQVKAVRAVRQICFLLYKLELESSTEAKAKVINNFIDNDRALPDVNERIPLTSMTSRALDNALKLIWWTLRDLDPLDIVPKHGPGALATGEKPWEKMNFRRFYRNLDEVYSYPEYFFLNYDHLCEELESLECLEEFQTSTAKVVLVPKDSRGPRLISMEPLEIQWIQQGLMRALFERIEHPTSPCFGFVNFTNQEINREHARNASNSDEIVTVDMKDASDRVSLWLVKRLFPKRVYDALYACRSSSTQLPNGHVLSLRKFASMGSACCFPVEALIFWALAVGSVKDVISYRDLHDLPSIYVFGDDIICSKLAYEKFSIVFEEVFLRFNKDKCCTGRYFKESCGMDAFRLQDVSPIRVKSLIGRRLSPAAALSYVSCVNRCRERGYTDTADFLQQTVTVRFGSVPVANVKGQNMLVYERPLWSDDKVKDYLHATFKCRWNRHLHRYEVKVPLPLSHVIKHGEPSWSELLRLFPHGPQSRGEVKERLEPCSHTVPHQIKMRWVWVAEYQLLAGI